MKAADVTKAASLLREREACFDVLRAVRRIVPPDEACAFLTVSVAEACARSGALAPIPLDTVWDIMEARIADLEARLTDLEVTGLPGIDDT